MTYSAEYATDHPTRDEVEAIREPTVVEFGQPGCGHCQAAAPLIKAAFAAIQPPDSTACPYCKLKEYQESGKTIQYKAGGETCDATWHITGECGAHEVNGKRVSKAASARLNRRKHKEAEAGLAHNLKS